MGTKTMPDTVRKADNAARTVSEKTHFTTPAKSSRNGTGNIAVYKTPCRVKTHQNHLFLPPKQWKQSKCRQTNTAEKTLPHNQSARHLKRNQSLTFYQYRLRQVPRHNPIKPAPNKHPFFQVATSPNQSPNGTKNTNPKRIFPPLSATQKNKNQSAETIFRPNQKTAEKQIFPHRPIKWKTIKPVFR